MKTLTIITALATALATGYVAGPRDVATPPLTPAASGQPAACPAAERGRRAAALRDFRRRMAAARRAYFRTHRRAGQRRTFVRRQTARLRSLEARLAACARPAPSPPTPQPTPAEPLPFSFYPQAGILGRDLFVANHVDLDDGPGIRDFGCGSVTYDGHGGQDTGIRTFREQLIGVPVFAALDGTVKSVQDYEDDMNFGPTRRLTDNHVILSHGGTQETVYGHLRRGRILVKVGQRVRAGQQVGWTASSGNSSGPHLHFGARFRFDVYEPFAGPCRPGRSFWTEQPAVPRALYAWNVVLSPEPFTGRAGWPWDEAARTGTFVRGERDVHVRVELANAERVTRQRVRFLRPDGSVALDAEPEVDIRGREVAWLDGAYRVGLDTLGRWTVAYEADGQRLFEAPFDVVASAAEVVNRAPAAVAPRLVPAAPRTTDVVRCELDTSLVTEDPDYDVVSYRYRWTAGGRVLREVTSAALSDVLAQGSARPGETVSCAVTPSDGRLDGPAASVSAQVP